MGGITAQLVAELTARWNRRIDQLIDGGFELGVQVALYHEGRPVVEICQGRVAPGSAAPVRPDTVFPVCSTGKGIVATLLNILAERGVLDFAAPVTRYWPEYGVNGKAGTTVLQAVTHQAGIPNAPQFSSFDEVCDWSAACGKVAALPLSWQPGAKMEYHSRTWGWIAGRIAEGAAGCPLPELLRREITGPLGIEREMFFGTDAEAETRVSPFVPQPVPGEQCSTAKSSHVVDQSNPVAIPLMDFVNLAQVRQCCMPAVNGIMSARAIARHYAALLGPVDGVRLLSESTLRRATTVQTSPHESPRCFGHGFGLGYPLKGPQSDPGAFFGHGGAGGSEGMANRALNFAIGITKNRMDTHQQAPGHTNVLLLNDLFAVFGCEGDGGFYAGW